jgi:hypothetical protein
MGMELHPLVGVRQSGESDNAVIACNDWLRMGPGRSLPGLLEKLTTIYQSSPPTQSEGTLKQWSSKFGWAERATEFDANWDVIQTQERTQELSYGLSLDFERIRKLKRLSDFLEGQIYEQGANGQYHNVWCPDVKIVGQGDRAEVVDIERFNTGLIVQYRETLNDLAKEAGGRVVKSQQELTGKNGGAIDITMSWRDVVEAAKRDAGESDDNR